MHNKIKRLIYIFLILFIRCYKFCPYDRNVCQRICGICGSGTSCNSLYGKCDPINCPINRMGDGCLKECYNGLGHSFKGYTNVSSFKKPCLNWSKYNFTGRGNYCQNIRTSNETGIWCLVKNGNSIIQEPCDVVQCPKLCSKKGWGSNCERECFCKNGGRCHAEYGFCECPLGYTGELCDIECRNPKHASVCSKLCCFNGGICKRESGLCKCPKNRMGSQCQLDCLQIGLIYSGDNSRTISGRSCIDKCQSDPKNISLECLTTTGQREMCDIPFCSRTCYSGNGESYSVNEINKVYTAEGLKVCLHWSDPRVVSYVTNYKFADGKGTITAPNHNFCRFPKRNREERNTSNGPWCYVLYKGDIREALCDVPQCIDFNRKTCKVCELVTWKVLPSTNYKHLTEKENYLSKLKELKNKLRICHEKICKLDRTREVVETEYECALYIANTTTGIEIQNGLHYTIEYVYTGRICTEKFRDTSYYCVKVLIDIQQRLEYNLNHHIRKLIRNAKITLIDINFQPGAQSQQCDRFLKESYQSFYPKSSTNQIFVENSTISSFYSNGTNNNSVLTFYKEDKIKENNSKRWQYKKS
ncbi:DgyrCDS10833 [Dimorphilus gyrociliatus]|uniref:DgyrCDS10833 n=1 Tax=Dimorphilus gyrociliatus TaxID=2664684 RepID=A0A7I8W1J8_9ANNE|nr:DgyrCDS10833 [Dimorphilus gyrociliatus]